MVQQAVPVGLQQGSGRACQRGDTRAELRPGGDVAALAARLGGIDVGGEQEGRHERMLKRYIEPRTRPDSLVQKSGTSGSVIPLMTNYFRLRAKPNWTLYQYHVSFSPEVDSKKVRIALVKQHMQGVAGGVNAFDGTVLFLTERLPENPMELFSQRKTDGENIRVTVKLTNELPPDSPTCMHMYNIIFRRVLSMIEMKQIGRHYYNPKAAVAVERHGLEVWPGFITSIMQAESSVLLCAEISHKILRIQSVLDLMKETYQRSRDFHREIMQKLVGQIVLTRYNNKTYRIDDIAWETHPSATFQKGGSEVSFTDYYRTQYNLHIQDEDLQPMLVSNPKKSDIRRGQTEPILLVPELCFLTGLSDEVRTDYNIMRDVAVHTRVNPTSRVQTLNTFIRTITSNPEVTKELSGWGLNFDDQLIRFQGRTLPAEVIVQKDRSQQIVKTSYNPRKADWSGNMREKHLLSPESIQNWMLVVSQRDLETAQNFCEALARVGPPMGMHIGRPTIVKIPDGRPATFVRAIDDNLTPSTQLVTAIVPSNKKDAYDAIKKLCCITKPVPSQVVVARTLNKPKGLMSVATKIAIQMNCKLGGDVWGVEMPLKSLMVIGIDCYHDSGSKGRSVGGFVASMNPALTKYYSRVTFQHNHQELWTGLSVCMTAALKNFNRVNGSLPRRIVIYRDGVGDGQLDAVLEHETPQLLDCFKDIGADYNPKVSIVVVKKRINSRFFASGGGNELINPPPGTVVDNTVTRPDWYDFFLVSQSVNQGTVTPTHYHVIKDTNELGPDKMQRLTYKLTHLYYNWPGTIRVPAPCMYAHKLAFLVGQSLHENPSLELSDKLYFL